MKILVTGVGGQLGYDVMKVLKAREKVPFCLKISYL